ncbi:MAG: SUMF1/EgtB/PvdO family nonheme iron enzyme [Bacteroidota bacterium]
MSLRFVVLLGSCLLVGCSGSRLPDGFVPLEMVEVEGGTFLVGDVHDQENTDALPLHERTISDFRLMAYEVTFEAYDAYARATGVPVPNDEGMGRGRRAVAQVNWDEAQAFCEAYGWRLPTEIEYEYAARSGGEAVRWSGTNSEDSLAVYAWYGGQDRGVFDGAIPVGSKQPNALGLHDLSGGVREWVGAYYQFYPEPGSEPEWSDLEVSGIRIFRGGGRMDPPEFLQTFWRMGALREDRMTDVGFRCAADGG